ncbi:MAG: gamma-glutamyltransferase family protein [bacterium]|nr:gamma-glutamyltransferase family protein [bacterium]
MSFTTRPTLRGFGGGCAAGHYLATQAGAQMLAEGGNAADAACAMGFALQVLEPHMNGPAGEVPILMYHAAQDRVFSISGQGVAPAAASIETFRNLGIERIPGDGLMAATVPAALDAWCLLLARFGTRRLADVIAPARGLAERGFPMYPFLRAVLTFVEKRFRDEWPSSAELYLPIRRDGERQTNPAYARLLGELADTEARATGDRETCIQTARDSFYKGRAAEQIEAFCTQSFRDGSGQANSGLLRADDLASYEGCIEEPASASYRGAHVWKCPPWTQGPVFLQQLRLAEGFPLAEMGHGSADALHTWIECAKLAMADREACYGDPRFADVPLDALLSEAYSAMRRKLVDPAQASLELRPGKGRLPEGWPWIDEGFALPSEPQALAHAAARGRSDTTHLDVADRFGNLVSATPSGAWIPSSPVISELGFPIGTRAQMFNLDPQHPNGLAPGKRPRTTLTPSIAQLPDGRMMAFGTPGGDGQDQWTVQFFQNLVDFGMRDLQTAIDAPTVHTTHMPDSFFPRLARPGGMAAEARISENVVAELERRGHRVQRSGPWEHGRVLAVTHDASTGLFEAAASPRSVIAYAAALG